MPGPVTVIAETMRDELTPSTLECVEEAREIAAGPDEKVHVLLAGHRVEGLASILAAHGADCITVVEHEALAQFSADGWLAAMTPPLQRAKAAMIIAPDSGCTRCWLPRLSARWRRPLATGCIRVKVTDEGYPEVYRISHGGRLHQRLIWARGTPIMAMLAEGVRGAGPPAPGKSAEVRVLRPDLQPATFRDRTLRSFPPDPHDVDLGDAERIVSGGLGVGSADGMALLQQLAEALNASLGGTRVAADRGWLPAERFIGTTGKIVAPRLYIAIGLSGAGQHVAGMNASEVIIAINSDRSAPVFKIVDLGVVGDLHEIVPLLIRRLQQHAQRGAAPGAVSGAARGTPEVPARESVA